MAGTAISIDPAASGLLRHRFVRALTASTFVLMAIGFIYLTVGGAHAAFQQPDQQRYGPIFAALTGGIGLALIVLLMFFIFSIIVALIAAAFGAVHRRLAALVLLIVNLAVVGVGAMLVLTFVLDISGQLEPGASTQNRAPWQNYALYVAFFIAAFIAFEGVGWAWWQLRLDRGQYFAARGYRPPPWRIYSTMRQAIGLPAFVSNFGRGRGILTFIYFLAAILNIGLIALLAIPFVVFSIKRGADLVEPMAWVAGGVALLLLNAAGVGVLLQKIAAAQATRLYQKAREWDARPPVLFLRAFNQDAEKLKARSRDPLVKFPAGCGEARTLDELLLESASVYGPVIAIGDPRDPTPPLGAARVFVQGEGNEWQQVVTQLLTASNAVVMCPSTSEGVKWELDLITDAIGRLRIIFLANPQLSPEGTRTLFERIGPQGETPALVSGQTPIAAYMDAHNRWTVLTTKRPPCVQTYSVALNYALQATLGMKGAPLPRQHKRDA